jgi:hypothetical protein
MQKALFEDSHQVKESVEVTEKLKKRALENFDAIEKENIEEKKEYEL